MGTSLKTVTVKLKVTINNDDPDLIDKIAGRAYTISGVVDVTAKLKKTNEQQVKQSATSLSSNGQGATLLSV
jgi:hypothetical protein